MSWTAVLPSVLCLLVQEVAPPLLEIDAPVKAKLGSSSERAETPWILASAGDRIPALQFRAPVAEPGWYHVDLVSYTFDAYLVVRDAEGKLVAESNDGLVSTHARVAVELAAGDYRVQACALDRRTGPFELRLARGRPADPTDEERRELDLADARAGVAALVELDRGGSQHAGALERLAKCLLALQRPAEARDALVELLELRESSGKLLEAARVALSLARIQRELGSPTDARREAERAVTLFESERGADDPETAEARTLLGTLDFEAGALERAVASFDRALFSLSKAHGPTDPRTIAALEQLSTALAALGRHDEARRRDEAFLPLMRTSLGPRAPETRALLARLASAARRQADLGAARPWLVELVESAEPLSTHEGMARVELARVLMERGRDHAAAEQLERALALLERALGSDAPETVECAFDLAHVLASIGSDERARELFERVLASRDEGAEPASVAQVRVELGLLAARDPTKSARELLLRARADLAAALGSEHPRTLAVGVELARLADARSAADELERIAESAARVLGEDHALVGRARVELGRSLVRDGRSSEARAELERGRAALVASLGAGHAESIAATTSLARVLVDAGNTAEARELLSADLAARPPVAWESFNHATERARFAALSAEREELELLLSSSAGKSSKDSSEHEIAAYEAFARWRAWRASERFAGRAALEQRASDAGALLAELEIVRTQIARRASVLEPSGPATGPADAAGLHVRAREIEAELARRLGSPPARLPYERLAWGLPPKSALVDFASLRTYRSQASGGNFDEPHLFAWITRNGPATIARVDLGPTAELGALVEGFVDALRARGEARERCDALAELAAARIWRPVAERLGGELQVFTVLDPAIAALPFEALPAGDGALLLERTTFVQLTDASRLAGPDGGARELPTDGEGGARPSALFAVGAVDYGRGAARALDASAGSDGPGSPDDPEGDAARIPAAVVGAGGTDGDAVDAWRSPSDLSPPIELAPLEGSGAEIDLVARLHAELTGREGRRLSIRGADANAARVASAMSGQSAIHLATRFVHVPAALLFDPLPSSVPAAPGAVAPGLLAGLAMAGADAGALLATRSLGLLDLGGVELIALTGASLDPGDARSGEELLGLVRVLESAGARSVVASRWRPEQEDLSSLLEAFYRELWGEHRSAPDALRRAQLAGLARARAADGDPHPERWAGWFATLARP